MFFTFFEENTCPGDVQNAGLQPTFLAPLGLHGFFQYQDFVVENVAEDCLLEHFLAKTQTALG